MPLFKKKIPEDNNVLDLYFLFRDDTEFKTVLFEILVVMVVLSL